MDPVRPVNDLTAAMQAWNGLRSMEQFLNIPKPLKTFSSLMPAERRDRILRIRTRRLQKRRNKKVPAISSLMISMLWDALYPVYVEVIRGRLYNSILGFNLAANNYSTFDSPFLNLFLQGSMWFSNGGTPPLFTPDPPPNPNNQGRWDPNPAFPAYPWNEGPDIPVDAFGYPTEIPEWCYADRILRVGGSAAWEPGYYTVFWTGDGHFGDNSRDHYGWDGLKTNTMHMTGQLISEDLTSYPKRAVFQLTGVGEEVHLRLKKINPIDPIQNIVVCRSVDEHIYRSGERFKSAYLDKMAIASSTRFMVITSTNHNPCTTWNTRVPLDHCIQMNDDHTKNGVIYRSKGVSYELLCQMANKTYLKRIAKGASDYSVWVCAPHGATDDYFYQMGRLFKEGLIPNISVRIEYSNEVWNSGLFDQGMYAYNQGIASNIAPGDNGFDNQIFFSARKHMKFWEKFREGWDSIGDPDSATRVINVMGGWHTNADYNRKILGWVDPLTGHAAWENCDEVALAPYFDGVGIPYSDLIEAHWAPEPNTTYSFTIDGVTVSHTTPVSLDMNVSEQARREVVAMDFYSQVENSALLSSPSSRYEFIKPVYENGLLKGFKLFYKLTPAFTPKVVVHNNGLPYRHEVCRLNGGYHDDTYQNLPTSWSDRVRYENWRVSLTAEQTIGYCLAECEPGGFLDRELQNHRAVLDAQAWAKKPRITYYELGTHLYSEWISGHLKDQLTQTLSDVEDSPLMKTLATTYLATLARYISGNNVKTGVISWFEMTGLRSKWGSWGLWLPGSTPKLEGVLEWVDANHY